MIAPVVCSRSAVAGFVFGRGQGGPKLIWFQGECSFGPDQTISMCHLGLAEIERIAAARPLQQGREFYDRKSMVIDLGLHSFGPLSVRRLFSQLGLMSKERSSMRIVRLVRPLSLALGSLAIFATLASAQSLPHNPVFRPIAPMPQVPDSTSPVLGTLSVNPYAQPMPVYPPSIRHELPQRTQLPGTEPAIVGRDGQYLGRLNGNRYDPQSVNNPYGQYGSPYSPTSINNPYSIYGSPYSTLSPYNPYTTTPPLIVGR